MFVRCLVMKKSSSFTIGKICVHTIILSIVASISHFAYEWSGKNRFIGLWNPVNESIWEHLKLMFFPFLLWWIIIYVLRKRQDDRITNTWYVSAAVALIIAPLTVLLLYYGYSSALGMDSSVLNMLLTGVGYFVALWIAAHLLNFSQPDTWIMFLTLTVVVVMLIVFLWFTFNPPQLPIFSTSG